MTAAPTRADVAALPPVTLHINSDGSQWWLERPHYTGTDIGPAHYSQKPLPAEEIAAQIAFYSRAGYAIDDKRPAALNTRSAT